ncbi:MAG: TetR/AcrR family transcriptional regulator [Gordonia paraffinivorans]
MTTTEAETSRAADRRAPRDRILAAAAGLFYREGINATGVELIADTAGVSKRTLYKYFPSKTHLVDQYLTYVREKVVDPRTVDGDDPRERLLALFAVSGPVAGRLRGCPFHNAAVEAASAMPEVTEHVQAEKRAFAEAVVELCRACGVEDPRRLGRQIALLYEGAAALSTSLDDAEPWAVARATAETLVDRAG